MLINIGYGNFASREKLVAVLKPGSSPLRRLVREAREDHMLLDATLGRKTRSILIMNSGHIILSPSLPETIIDRSRQNKLATGEDDTVMEISEDE